MAKRKILLISSGWFHPSLIARWRLRKILSTGDKIKITRLGEINHIEAINLQAYSAVILFIHREHLGEKAFSKLQNFVQSGGGLLAVHSVTASFKTNDDWFDLLGGRFQKHGPIELIKLKNCSGESSPFSGLPNFEVKDELYIHDLKPEIVPIFQTDVNGIEHPLIWQKNLGTGRVFYACPGHCVAVFNHPDYQKVLLRGLDWVCGG